MQCMKLLTPNSCYIWLFILFCYCCKLTLLCVHFAAITAFCHPNKPTKTMRYALNAHEFWFNFLVYFLMFKIGNVVVQYEVMSKLCWISTQWHFHLVILHVCLWAIQLDDMIGYCYERRNNLKSEKKNKIIENCCMDRYSSHLKNAPNKHDTWQSKKKKTKDKNWF